MDEPSESTPNSLGLNLETLHLSDGPEHPTGTTQLERRNTAQDTATVSNITPTPDRDAGEALAEESALDSGSPSEAKKEKKKPYVNPERVKTGGSQRDKLSEEELSERMKRIREQNEKIKQRRIDVQADEDQFKKTQEAERARIAKTQKVQQNVDRTREQNARRKMEKIQNREWDSGKQNGDWKQRKKSGEDGSDANNRSPPPKIGIRGAVRGGGAGRGRIRETPTVEGDGTFAEASNAPAAEGTPVAKP